MNTPNISKQAMDCAEEIATMAEWVEAENRHKLPEAIAQLIQAALDEQEKEARDIIKECKASIIDAMEIYCDAPSKAEKALGRIDAFLARTH